MPLRVVKRVMKVGHSLGVSLAPDQAAYLDVMRGDYVVIETADHELRIRKLGKDKSWINRKKTRILHG